MERIDNSDIEQWIHDTGLQFTDLVEESIYILRDGRLISGGFDYGVRGEEHRCIDSLVELSGYDSSKWKIFHTVTDMVMVVPETKELLLMNGQVLTPSQTIICNEAIEKGFSVSCYC